MIGTFMVGEYIGCGVGAAGICIIYCQGPGGSMG
jgi:hypothetical protein